MIYLIDDTPIQMLEGYMKPTEFSDVFKRMDTIPLDDIPSLAGAACVLIHSSFGDTAVKRRVQDLFEYGDVAPVVLFSDGDGEEAKFNGDNYIISIKKSVLYSRLQSFLKDYRKNGRVDLGILSGKTSAVVKKKTTPVGSNNVFAEYFSNINLDFAPEKEKTNDGPCAFCIGREGMNAIASRIGGEYIKINVQSLQAENEREQDIKIHDFLMTCLSREASLFILDTDANPAIFMQLALHIRLTETLPGKTKFAPLLFVSDHSLERLIKRSRYAQIFMTDGAFICHRSDVDSLVNSMTPLNEDSFKSGFLDKISIPAPKGSNHSLANQWGASRLYMLICGQDAKKDAFKDFQDIHKRLYFKYISHKIPSGDISRIRQEGNVFQAKGTSGKRILLIDDEAKKGWTKVISLIMPYALFNPKEDVIEESVLDYESLSENARSKIEHGSYDLILLDLRLGGIKEDYIVDPEQMSGYKVLQQIKRINRGSQVIMLTASNKAWNLKTLMNPNSGADGYFVKESPEYEFSDELSAANLYSLIKDIERCLERVYLKDFWLFIRSFDNLEGELVGEVKTQLGIAYEMASRAVTPEDYGYAYLALYQTIEIVTSRLTDWKYDTSDKDIKLLYLPGGDYSKELVIPSDSEVLWRFKPLALQKCPKNKEFPQKEKIAALYLQTWKKEDRGLLFLMDQLVFFRNAFIHTKDETPFKTVAKTNEGALQQNVYLRDDTFVYGTQEFKPLFREAAKRGLLFADTGKRPVLHKDIIKTQLGIKLLLACLKELLPLINL